MSTPARAALRAAHQVRDNAIAQHEKAQRAAARAEELLIDTENELAQFDALEAEITAHSTNRIRDWASEGGERPTFELTVDLSARHQARERARAKRDSAAEASKMLMVEAEAARQLVVKAATAVRHAAIAVINSDVGQQISELLELEQRAFELRRKIKTALDQIFRVPDADAPLQRLNITYGLMKFFDEPANSSTNVDGALPSTTKPMADAWQEYYAALTADPDAPFRSPEMEEVGHG